MAQQPIRAVYPNPDSLVVEMRKLEDAAVIPPLPPEWRVKTGEGDLSISTEGLKEEQGIEGAHRWLHERVTELTRYKETALTPPEARPLLKQILARQQFRPSESRTWWDSYRDRFNAWLRTLIEKMFGSKGLPGISGFAVACLAIAGAMTLLAVWTVNLLRSDQTRLKLETSPYRGPLGSGDDWIAAMRAAHDSGDLRKAVQCAYWAAVARLQDSGALPTGSTRTPRENLRHVTSATSAAAGPLRTLTASLERFWYAGTPATPSDFSRCLASLEDLGWRLR